MRTAGIASSLAITTWLLTQMRACPNRLFTPYVASNINLSGVFAYVATRDTSSQKFHIATVVRNMT